MSSTHSVAQEQSACLTEAMQPCGAAKTASFKPAIRLQGSRQHVQPILTNSADWAENKLHASTRASLCIM